MFRLYQLFSLVALLPAFAAEDLLNYTNYWTVSAGVYSESGPALDANGVIYVSTWDGCLYAINPDRTTKWEFHVTTDLKSSPAIAADGTIYVGCRDRKFYAITPDGKKKWEFKTGGWVDSSAGIATDGTIYFGSWDNKFYALNPNGSVRWTFTTSGEVESSPAIGTDGTIYFGSHDKKFYALNPDGSKRWQFATGGQIISSPAIGADGALYFTSVDGKLYALNPDGTRRWSLLTGGITESSPVLGTNGTIYVGVNSNYCAISSDGKKLWSHRLWQYFPNDFMRGTAAVGADGFTYCAAEDHRFWKVAPDGQWKWLVWLDGSCKSSPVFGADGTAYLVNYNGQLFGIRNVTTLADTPWPMFRADAQHTGRVRKVK
ncbi:MAG: cell surface protein [Pedosphaera sp.]|nr:cell surface protein [Pedosphaera sp.]